MPTLHFTVQIDGSREGIFALIADITQYDHWLPSSSAFGAVTQTSSNPIGLGTTYVDEGPSGEMCGSITEYDPPTHIAFQQSMPVKRLLVAGTLDLHIRYMLEDLGQITRINREVSFYPNGVLKAAQPFITATVSRESERLLHALKSYVEK